MLTRRDVLLGAGGAMLAARPLFAATQTLTAADVHVTDYPTVEAVRWMGQMLERETQGRLAIHVYHSGQLGREGDTVDLARFGALDLTRVNLAALNNAFPLTQVLSLPYVFDSTGHMRRAVDGPVGAEILAGFAARDLVGLAFYDSGARCFYNTRRAIHEPQDLKGLRIRVPPSDMFIGLVRSLGANPTPLSYGEVFSALQTRLIDGAENNCRSFHSSRQFEVARHWADSAHSYSPEALLMSKRRFLGLAPADQELVRETARLSVPYMRALWDKAEAESRAAVQKAGVEITSVDRAAFEAAAAPLRNSYLAAPALARLHRAIREVA
ncbi:MAG TPA: TRAP transporter substrate-binding protein [Steroidobacteraceae bacterium]|nr:TRAP transporter substrate-binding protein [Steroidobacteraceae bacterium]